MPARKGRKSQAPIDKQKKGTARQNRHSGKCLICKHPDRLKIEIDFKKWLKVRDIYEKHGLDDTYASFQSFKHSMREHADAFSLNIQRMNNVKPALARILTEGLDRLNSVNWRLSDILKAAELLAKASGELGGDVNVNISEVDRMKSSEELKDYIRGSLTAVKDAKKEDLN
jgi:hypothetical protein